MDRLEDQLAWYDAKATKNRVWYQTLKVVQIVVAAAIPVVAAAGASATIAGALGAVIVVLEGLQQLFQFQQNWVSFRGTAEALKREKYLFSAGAGIYANAERADVLLAEQVEALISRETTAWASTRVDGDADKSGAALPGGANES